ncbi:937_t:CDS:2, partial [Entrophospora sp. SA101]
LAPMQSVINNQNDDLNNHIPAELLRTSHPKPIRHEIVESKEPLKTKDLENLDIDITLHREPVTISDKIAFRIVKLLRMPTDWLFKKNYIHRAVMLETAIGGTIRHLKSLRKLEHDGGWIEHLLHEAENERQYAFNDMDAPKTAHRVVGYLEEEAIISYTSFLNEIDKGNIENLKTVPDLATDYWHLDRESATLRDVVLAVRADEATHRDTNHHLADRILLGREDLREDIKKVFDEEKSNRTRKMAGMNQNAQDKWKW